MLIKIEVFDLKSKSVRFSSKCSLGIKVHACDPNMPHVAALVPWIINDFIKRF